MGNKSSHLEKHSKKNVGFQLSSRLTSNDFTFLQVVGKGSFNKVMKVQYNKDGKTYILKAINKMSLTKHKADDIPHHARDILCNMNHPFIVSLCYAFQSETKLFLITDFFDGQDLFFNVKNKCHYDIKQSQFYSAELCVTLGHIHSCGIIYGCLKPENILLNKDGHVIVTDFDLTERSLRGDNLVHISCVDTLYLAPEMIKKNELTKAVDWWSFGALLYQMMTGVPPFWEYENDDVLRYRILNDEITFPDDFNDNAKALLLQLLQKDPHKRLGNTIALNADDIKQTLVQILQLYNAQHTFIIDTIVSYLPMDHGAEEIQRQLFYDDIDFEKIANKEIKPPAKS